MDKIKKSEEETKRKDSKHETKKYTYGFQQYQTIRSFSEITYSLKLK